jgi:predicted nucleic acid-binding Zn ribbon protein
MTPRREESLQFDRREGVFGRSGKPQLAHRLNRHQRVSAIKRRTIATRAQFAFCNVYAKTAQRRQAGTPE